MLGTLVNVGTIIVGSLVGGLVKKVLKEEIWVKKTMLFTKVSVEEKKEIRTFWRSKKFPHIEA
jgi:hypothetical protein